MIEIKPATKTELPLINNLAHTIWAIAYKDILSPEQLTYMLKKMNSVAVFSKLISDDHYFIIPYENGVAKGYACYKIYEEKIRIEKIYVLTDQHKKGIGKLLINYIIEKATPATSCIELNVNRQNNAVEFYKKIGFIISGEADIPIGDGYFMNDYIMRLAL